MHSRTCAQNPRKRGEKRATDVPSGSSFLCVIQRGGTILNKQLVHTDKKIRDSGLLGKLIDNRHKTVASVDFANLKSSRLSFLSLL